MVGESRAQDNPVPGAVAPGDGPERPPRSGRARVGPLVVVGAAVLALLVALGSLAVAWRALDQARDAKAIALADRGPQPTAGGPTTAGSPTPPVGSTEPGGAGPVPDAPRSPGSPPELNARTAYDPKYQDQAITLNARCGYGMYVDLDEPRANVAEAGSDLTFQRGCSNEPSTLRLGDDVTGSQSAQPGMTPQDCGERIRTAPVANDTTIPVRKGIAFCATTDYSAAQASGRPWLMVLAEITAEGNDGSVTLKLTAWTIPG